MSPKITKPVEDIILKKVGELKTREQRLTFIRGIKATGVNMPKGFSKMSMAGLYTVCIYAYTETVLALYLKPKVI